MLAFAVGKRFLGGGKIEIDLKALQTVLLQGFSGTNELFDRYSFPESENEALTAGVMELVTQAGFN